MAQSTDLKLGATANVMTLLIYADEQPPMKLHSFFGQYMQPYSHIQLKNKPQFTQAIQNVANKIDDKTLLTVYYRGYGLADGLSNWLIPQQSLTQGGGASKSDGRIALSRDLLQPLLQKKPLGIVLFYDAKAEKASQPAFVKAALPDVAVFYPSASGAFIDLPQYRPFLSLPISDWEFVKNSPESLENNLNRQRFSHYCLYPRRQGCDKPASAKASAPQAVSTSQTSATCPVTHAYRQLPLAVVELSLQADCLKNQAFTVKLDHYVYGGQFDAAGKATVTLFPTQTDSIAQVNTTYVTHDTFPIVTRNIESIERIILSWYGEPQLDLHVLPPRTTVNSNADIWRKSACSKTVMLRDRRFDCLTATDNTAMNMQIYTHPLNSNKRGKQRKLTTLRVDYASRGSMPQPPYCDNGKWSTIDYRIQQISRARYARGMTVESVPCEQALNNEVRYFEINEKIRSFE